MPRIQADRDICTVVVTVDATRELIGELESHARDGLRRFAEFPGFLGGALHRSSDGERLVQYLQWRSEADHLACMNDPAWDDLPSSRHFMDVVRSGRATLHVGTYEVLAAVD